MKRILPTKEKFDSVAKLTKSTFGAAKMLGVHFATFKKYTVIYNLDVSHHDGNSSFHAKYKPQDLTSQRVWERGYSDGNLTLEEFRCISQQLCWYCAAMPFNKANWYKGDKRSRQARIDAADFIYNGLDRVDNLKHHIKNNLVPCCKYCNIAKMEMSLQDFRSHLLKIISFRVSKYNGSFSGLKIPILVGILFPTINRLFKTKSEAVVPGAIFGKLTVIKRVNSIKNRKAFLCFCECGNEKVVAGYYLRRGDTTTCGGPGICQCEFLPEIRAARALWINTGYKKEGLSFEEYYELSQMLCIYCGEQPLNLSNPSSLKINVPFIYNGLDRLDSSKGHTLDNVVPCCWNCNRMKSNRSLTDFNQWLTDINNHWLVINTNGV